MRKGSLEELWTIVQVDTNKFLSNIPRQHGTQGQSYLPARWTPTCMAVLL